jgi:hypothetical protein
LAAHQGIVCFGSIAHPLGLLAARRGQRDRAERLLVEAARRNDAIGARPAAARVRRDLARLKADAVLERAGLTRSSTASERAGAAALGSNDEPTGKARL